MSGHKIGEKTYFVPRTLLPLQHSAAWHCRKLLPNAEKWRRQRSGRGGDKSECCKTFPDELSPQFVEVLVQDGIYLVNEFPDHPMSHLLKVSKILW
jgi:hypothetical protein